MDAPTTRPRQPFELLADRLHAVDDRLGIAYLRARIALCSLDDYLVFDRFAEQLADILERRGPAPRAPRAFGG